MSFDLDNFINQFQPDQYLFQRFVEKTHAVFWLADPVTFQLIYVSPYVGKVLDILPEEWLRPLFWQTYLHWADLEHVLAGFETAVSEQITHQIEYRLKTDKEALLWIRNTVCTASIEEKSYLCGMITDVTTYKTAVRYPADVPGYASILLDIVTLLSKNLDIKQRLDQLVIRLSIIFEVTAVNILDWDQKLGIATRLAHYPIDEPSIMSDENSYHLAGLEGSLKWLMATHPVLSQNTDATLSAWETAHLQKYNAKSILYLPLRDNDELIGCIELIESRTLRRFSQNDMELGQILARQTAIALVKAQLFYREARRRREAEILLDVAEFVSSSLDRDEILSYVMEIIRVYLADVKNCIILLISKDEKMLETVLSWQADEEFYLMPTGNTMPIEETFVSQLAIEGGESVVITDLREVPFINEYTAQKIEEGLRTILCVPLKIQDRALGTLLVHYWHQPRQFTAEEITLVQGVANQTAIAIENARLFANERRQLHLAQTLQKVGSLLTASLQIDAVYEQIFDLLGQVIFYSSSALYLFDKANDRFFLVAYRGDENTLLNIQDVELPASLLLSQIPLVPGWRVVSDVSMLERWLPISGEGVIKSWIGTLLIVKGEIIGVLNVDGASFGQYLDEDGQTVAAFANQAAIAIENARLHDETMRQAKELAILNHVAQETAVFLDTDIFLEKITQMVVADIYPHVVGFAMVAGEREELLPHASYHGISEKSKEKCIPVSLGIIGHVLQSGQPYVASDIHDDPYYHPALAESQSEVAVPLKVNSEVIGVLNVESPEKGAFSQRDVDFLMTLAGNIAAVLERARLYDTLRVQAEGLAKQVTKRTKELQFERDRLFTILESAGEGIILTDTDVKIVYVNQAMEHQSGYSRDDLIGKNPRIFGSKQMPRSIYIEMRDYLLNRERWVGELINQNKDGKNYDVAVTVTPIVDTDEVVTGYISVQSDISRLKELERLKTQFIANVSHQLRTPLTNIKTYVSLLEKGKPEKAPRYFSVLHFEIDRLARLIQDLLDISRLDAAGAPNPKAAVSFLEFWQTFWPPYIERSKQKNCVLETVLPENVVARAPIVFMEAQQLEKLLSRLVENALAYIQKGGKIQIVAAWQETDREKLEIKICDEGVGVPEAERPFIFDRFFRGAQAVESGLPGNGLGLAIVRELLERYGGDISLESEVGVGSCFTMHLLLVTRNNGTGLLYDAK